MQILSLAAVIGFYSGGGMIGSKKGFSKASKQSSVIIWDFGQCCCDDYIYLRRREQVICF